MSGGDGRPTPGRPGPPPKPSPGPANPPPPPKVTGLPVLLLPSLLLLGLQASGPARLVIDFSAHLT